jgi:hypothetical protein
MPTMTLSPQVKIVALVGVLLIALAGSAFFVMHGHASHNLTTPTTPQTTTTPHVHVVQPTVDPLLPAPLRAVLEHNAVVVVAFYDPHSAVARATITEAEAGAATAHVGFLRVNLLDDPVAGTLTALLPSGQLLPNPGIIIYKRPGTVIYRTDGYLDRAGIVEAVRGSK